MKGLIEIVGHKAPKIAFSHLDAEPVERRRIIMKCKCFDTFQGMFPFAVDETNTKLSQCKRPSTSFAVDR